jgi:hypothetical protein
MVVMHQTSFVLLLALAAASHPSSGLAQMPEETPERVEVADLLRSPSLYDSKVVMVRGDLRSGVMGDLESNIYLLRGQQTLREVRVGEPRGAVQNLRYLEGQRVLITGIFWDLAHQCYDTNLAGVQCNDNRLRAYAAVTSDFNREDKRYFIGILSVEGEVDAPLPKDPEPKEAEEEPPDLHITPGELIDLRDLVGNPTPYDGRRVSVIGKFRGNNLYNDLPIRTKKTPRDFIIKTADAAIWITGKRPRGKGFRLNPRMRRDTGKWLKVTGVPWMEDGMVYLRSERLELAPKPDDPALEPVDEEEGEEEKEKEPPPEVAFAVPMDGEREIPLDSEFRVQFTNDMNPASFDRNIDLLYADDDGTENPFPGLEIRYENAGRTLVVIPGKRLEPQKEIQLILYNGIVDEEGQALLASSTDMDFPDVAVMLTYFTAKQ